MRRLWRLLKASIKSLVLRLNGQRIIARNYATPAGRIPFVTLRGERLAFVEVRRGRVIPSRHKRRLIRAAQYWLAANPDFPKGEIAFDSMFGGVWPTYARDVFGQAAFASAGLRRRAKRSGNLGYPSS
jgi:putative endonuclease